MQQPQPRPLLGDSVSSTSSPNARRNNPVTVLTHQQLQQLQHLQAHNQTGQPLTFALQQSSNNSQDQGNGSATGSHIVYLNQLNQLNQGSLSHSGTGMGLPPAAPTFGVGLNMGLPLSLLNTNLTSLTSNAITTSNPLLNLGLPGMNHGLTALNPSLNSMNSINPNLSSNLSSSSISSSLSGLGQDMTSVNSGITSLNSLNSSGINSGLSNMNSGLTSVNPALTGMNQSVNQSLSSSVSSLSTLNPTLSTNLTTTSINHSLNHGINQTLNALTTGLTPSSINSSNSNSFPFQTIQSIQSIAPHIVSSNVSQLPNSSVHISSSGVTHIPSSSVFTHVSSGPSLTASKIQHLQNPGTMHPGVSNVSLSSDPNSTMNHMTSNTLHTTGFQPQRQFSQNLNTGLNSAPTLTNVNSNLNTINSLNSVKTMQSIQSQNISSPGSPFSIPLKSPASNIAPPTPSPSPNRLLLRSPASNSMQSNRNSPSPIPISTSNANFGTQMQSPMQSPMSVGQIQSPAPSPYPPAKSPHHLGGGTLNNRSPAPGGSPGPPVVRPNTPILQPGMQVLQIIHGTPQGYQQAPTQLVTRTHLIGNQQIQIATAKPAKQPPQILPKPPNQQTGGSQQKQQRVATTMTNQVPQQSQPQLVLAGHHHQNQTTMIPTPQGLLLNQVLPSSGPVIVQQQPGGVQLILRTPANAQQQTHTAQLQQQLVRVVTAQGMPIQSLAPTYFAVPNGFPPPAPPVIRHTPSSPAPSNTGGNPLMIQNAMVQSPQPQLSQVSSVGSGNNTPNTHPVIDQSLLPPPKKKAKKKKKTKRKDEEPPKLDLASIMKISGIGDDDDIFDNDLTTESESSQMQVEQSLGQNSPQISIPNSQSSQGSTQISITNTMNMNSQAQSAQTGPNSQLVTQLQMPVQNPISGQLRLALGEDGRFVLHHTPEPNQPEIDPATAQALIRSLTQSGGQNSQIISQLMGQAQNSCQQNVPTNQNQAYSRQRYAKSPLSSGNHAANQSQQVVNSPTNSHSATPLTSPQHPQISSQNSTMNSAQSPLASNNSSSQSPNIQIAMNVNSQPANVSKNVQAPNASAHMQHSGGESPSSKLPASCPKFQAQSPRFSNANQQTSNIQIQRTNQQARLGSPCLNASMQQNSVKYLHQSPQSMQKVSQSVHIAQRTVQLEKNAQNLQQMNLHQDHPQSLHQNLHQPMQSPQNLKPQNVQHTFQPNSPNLLHQNPSTTMQQNTVNTLQQNSGNGTQQNVASGMQQSMQHSGNTAQQQSPSSGVEQSLQHNVSNDLHHSLMTNAQQSAPGNMQQSTTSGLQNVNVQQSVNLQQQKVVISNSSCPSNVQQHHDSQNTANHTQQHPNTQQQQQQQQQHNILISNTPCSGNGHQNDPHKSQQGNMLNSAASNILNNAPKITPEILNALSNLNPNDQLLIANANGQMQVISQQLLQQFLAGQLNATQQTQNQNQTQKIVIGEPDSGNQSLQGVQINTPTSQIIVNSSGGAPTIQNNIQNIVVQAAPSQMPHQIQIQNSGFPSQFIDNLNQQQIRNLGNNQTNPNSTPKKSKVTKKAKVAVTLAQNIAAAQAKTITVTRPTMMTTTSAQKSTGLGNSGKGMNFASQCSNLNKSNHCQDLSNGPLTSSAPNVKTSIPSNGQMVQRVQTIQLSQQKQMLLKGIQAQIQTILARKPNTQSEQAHLAKLYEEQARILATGKVLSSTSHPVTCGTEATMSVNVVSAMVPTSQATSICKNQTSTAQTQTQSPPTISTTNTQNPNPCVPLSQNLQNNPGNAYIGNLMQTQSATRQNLPPQTSQALQTPNILQTPCKPSHKFYQNQDSQMLSPSATSAQAFSSPNNSASSIQNSAQHLSQAQQTGIQQSAQCQTDPLDVKPKIQALSPIKQEMPSPGQIQVQIGSPAGQMSGNSPRIASKGSQRIQSPVNIGATQGKQLVSPGSSPMVSPRQAVKRPASSPICRQINRSDLLEQQLKTDQHGASNPDVNTPFSSKTDASKRLLRYHCFNEQVLSAKDLAKADEIFEETAKHLLSKFNSMMNKYTYLLLMESMREVRTSELMMIDRTFVADEQSILNRLREQEAKANEELKKEEKPVVPKVEPGLTEDSKPPAFPANVSVKRELEDDYPVEGIDTKPVIKPSSCTSGDYDEWLEIQKELGVYPSTADTKCRNSNASGSASNSVGANLKLSKVERTRANGEYRVSAVSSSDSRNPGETSSVSEIGGSEPVSERRWSGATDLERDLLEDTDSLDGLALNAQAQGGGPSLLHLPNDSVSDNDDITAQVQSAIDSILNLKQDPSNPVLGAQNVPSTSQSGEAKDAALDQAVRSILGS